MKTFVIRGHSNDNKTCYALHFECEDFAQAQKMCDNVFALTVDGELKEVITIIEGENDAPIKSW